MLAKYGLYDDCSLDQIDDMSLYLLILYSTCYHLNAVMFICQALTTFIYINDEDKVYKDV